MTQPALNLPRFVPPPAPSLTASHPAEAASELRADWLLQDVTRLIVPTVSPVLARSEAPAPERVVSFPRPRLGRSA